ncbi:MULTISPECIES: HAD family phosphatase [Lactobacillus]|uniref:HAD family phosphatase n=1 Tax=Lactobacillus xujianguonis TaxID=2495899 RepID=A0A437SU08_9LACO|nr:MULTISPECIES: HAD family phosphatase [Lactobacillus]RVU70317.1 HAD family phosphatase [Lactobacillus xujianguonis]RVU73866.1 HAD family phosphatase [Lactobacillus xujianguonis]
MRVQGISDDIKGIIFDLDGLLVNSEELYWQANIQAAEEANLPIPRDSYLKLAGASVKEMEAFYHKYFKTTVERDKFIKRTDDLVWQWTDEGKLKLRPGVQAALDKFQELDLPLAIASSNYEDVLEHALWATGIRNYFAFHLSYLDVQKGHIKSKPAPDIYLAAAKKMALPKKNLLVFEDSPTGVQAAKNADIKVVMIPDILTPSAQDRKRATMICKNFFEFLKKI